jgi:hypothetical protein
MLAGTGGFTVLGVHQRFCPPGTMLSPPNLLLLTPLAGRQAGAAAHRVSSFGAGWALSATRWEFGMSVDWLLTGKTHAEPKTKVTGNSPCTD